MNRLFSNHKRVILDRITGKLFESNNPLEPVEAFNYFEQTVPSSLWTIKHSFINADFIIQVFIKNNEGIHTLVSPYKIYSKNDRTICVDFNGVEVIGYATMMFTENDVDIVEITPSPTPSMTSTRTPTPTPTPTITPTATNASTITPTPTTTCTHTATPTITPTVTMTITPTFTPTLTPLITQTVTPTVTNTLTVTPTLSVTPTFTPTVTPTITITPTDTE